MRLLPLLLLLPLSLCAKQLSFVRSGDEVSVRWEQGQEAQALTYRLERGTLPPLLIFSPERLRRDTLQTLLQQGKEQFPGVRFRLGPGGELTLQARSQQAVDAAMAWLATTRPKVEDEWLLARYFQRFTDPAGGEVVKQDHVRIALESRAELAPLAEQFKEEGGSEEEARRKSTAAVLAFVQAIPYALLDNSGIRGGRGFLAPRQVLLQNRGDCDSKVTLMAALLGQIYPNLKQLMIFTPDHALLGVELTASGEEQTLEWAGTRYLLMEPTGPAELPLGTLARSSQVMVESGQFRAQPVQATETNSTATR
ncbi:transglutaminase domain-containing protein [Aeromonas simiae]|uniref:transglutaminase domain-containing protein n=1 Tax=Aeromonas simiae TaxID=218936 RepID=UPI00266D61FC|nr:transglutaminase domain-containing protein [Aeromonas simiae]MDO2948464.1 transglutaminase domain-containing protein [Aeromonas simiae]MDO2951869.1 transglutaminase domain-containing protein [Aeromonas simiae]MDO2955847.1 transglutaminase domain-containing protein [Aeromonas simiae]